MMNAIKFPEKPMKIGDTFVQEVPMVMPLGTNSMSMNIKINYTLKEVIGNQAFFDYTQVITLDLSINQNNSTASGSGTGKMIYNIPSSYITDTTGDMTLNMVLSMGEMEMKMNAIAKSTLKARIL